MLRRSLRLQEAGYYTEEGKPTISYKERLYRVFQRRKKIKRNNRVSNQYVENVDMFNPQSEPNWTQVQSVTTNEVPTICRFPVKSAGCLFILLLLVFGNRYMQFQLNEVDQELQSLKKHVFTYFPLADTLPNFAMRSQGAKVLKQSSSNTYWHQDRATIWRFLCRIFSFVTQQKVIQGNSQICAGDGWCFSGNRGHLVIALSSPVSITHVTLGHITKSQSPTGNIKSAPREFSIYGMNSVDEEGSYLGNAVYDEDGSGFQTFKLANPDDSVYQFVKIQIDSNWGNNDYTCMYRFRVHGKLLA